LAGWLVALDPVLAAQARSVMTETLAAALLAAALAVLVSGKKGSSIGTGILLGLAALTRPSTLPGSGLVVLAALAAGPGPWSMRLRRGALMGSGLLLTLTPWAIRNARIFGEPVWTTTHGGYTLYLANNPEYYEDVLHGPPGATWSGPNQHRFFVEANRSAAGLAEPAADRLFKERALRFIAAHPLDFLKATGARLGRFWAIAPAAWVYSRPLRLATALWTIPFWFFAVRGLFRRDSLAWPSVAPWMMIVGLTLVHAVFWTDLRMRAPIVPALALLASRGVSRGSKTAVSPGETRGMLE
jgi:hypothetical protein